jgi:hypothetical protein
MSMIGQKKIKVISTFLFHNLVSTFKTWLVLKKCTVTCNKEKALSIYDFYNIVTLLILFVSTNIFLSSVNPIPIFVTRY